MKRRSLVVLLLLMTLVGLKDSLCQQSDLSILVKNFKNSIIETYSKKGQKFDHDRYLPIFLNNKPANYDMLDAYSLDDVQSVTLTLDKSVTPIYGTSGSKGVILITTQPAKQEDRKDKDQ